FQAEDGIRDRNVTGVQTCALPILLWHGGLSGSIPLTIATEDHFLADVIGVIPITETLLSNFNLFIVMTLLLSLPLLNRLLMKSRSEERRVGKACGRLGVECIERCA